MSRESSWSSSLLNAAQSRGIEINVSLDDLSRHDDASDVAEWVKQNLIQLKPLTSEELALFQHIDKSKSRLREPAAQDVLATVPVDEEHLLDAIYSLQCSTQRLRGRSRTMKGQIKISTSLDDFDNPNEQIIMSIEAKFDRQQDAEKQQMLFVNHEIQMDLLEKLQQTQDKFDKYIKSVASTIRERLKADDRILDGIAAPTTSVVPEDLAPKPDSHLLLAALQQTVVLNLKTHLDQVYLRELTAPDGHPHQHANSDELEQTHNDLQSLYSEVEDVASMLVETDFGMRTRSMAGKLRLMANDTAARRDLKLAQKLEALTRSAEQLSTSYQHLQAHRMMCQKLDQICSRIKAQDEADTLHRLPKETANRDKETSALLRHLGITRVELANDNDLAGQARSLSLSIADKDRLSVSRILENVQQSATKSHGYLRSFSSISNDDLSQALLQNKELDDRMISAKNRLEQAYGASNTSDDASRRFTEGL